MTNAIQSKFLFRKTDFVPQEKVQQDNKPQHKMVIAVDGPAASGKGTLARKMAERLEFAYLDTGALYRAVGLATLEMGGDPSSFDDVEPALALVKRNLTPELLANPALRTHDVSDASSKVAALPEVRIDLLDFQRNFAKNPPENMRGAVLDGRDIGTIVCPDADLKIFVTASTEERARRRHAELKQKNPDITFEKVMMDIIERDQRDSTRPMAPTRAANDAYIIDTTKLSQHEVLEEAVAVLRARMLRDTEDAVLA